MSGQFIAAGTIVIGTVAQLVHRAVGNGCHIKLYHPNGGKRVTLGTQGVTDQAGWVLNGTGDATIELDLPPKVELYGVCESGQTQSVNYLITEF